MSSVYVKFSSFLVSSQTAKDTMQKFHYFAWSTYVGYISYIVMAQSEYIQTIFSQTLQSEGIDIGGLMITMSCMGSTGNGQKVFIVGQP